MHLLREPLSTVSNLTSQVRARTGGAGAVPSDCRTGSSGSQGSSRGETDPSAAERGLCTLGMTPPPPPPRPGSSPIQEQKPHRPTRTERRGVDRNGVRATPPACTTRRARSWDSWTDTTPKTSASGARGGGFAQRGGRLCSAPRPPRPPPPLCVQHVRWLVLGVADRRGRHGGRGEAQAARLTSARTLYVSGFRIRLSDTVQRGRDAQASRQELIPSLRKPPHGALFSKSPRGSLSRSQGFG